MDFHGLVRRDLQTLCKKNRIPANMTNLAMADALQALQSVEGLAEIQEALQFQSPKKLDLESPRTSQRTTALRKVEAAAPKEQQASPLHRARRVTAQASEIRNLAEDAEEKEVAETPKVPNTRRRATAKKEEKPAVGMTAGRRARQSIKKEVEGTAMGVDSMMSTGLRRSTRVRGKAAASAFELAPLAKEAEEKLEKEAEAVVDQKSKGIEIGAETKEEEKFDGKDCRQELNLESEAIQESPEIVGEEQGTDHEKGEADDALTGFEGSPIRGLVSLDQDSNPIAEFENLETAAADDGGFELQEPPLSGESPAEIEDSGVQSPSLEIPPTSDDLISNVEITATQRMESSEENGELTEEIEESSGNVEVTEEAVESGDGNGEFTAETTEDKREMTVTDEAVDSGDGNGEITAETTEDKREMTEETTRFGDGDDEITEKGEESTVELSDLTVEIPVEVDESGGDIVSGALTGEISVVAVEAPEPETEIAGESIDEVIGGLSDLSLSFRIQGKVLPVAGDSNKENSGLTALTAMDVGPTVRGGGEGGGGASKEKPKGGKLNYENLSLRKLKAVYKEIVVTINKKGEEKRAALRAIDDNCI